MQKTKGISLIVLVITIIVMIILAGAVVISLNNSGIIGRAENAVEESNLATVKQLANLAWAEAYADGARTEQELSDVVKEALAKNNITEDKYKGYAIFITTSGVDFRKKELNPNGVIPEGGTYYVGVTSAALGDYTGATATYIAGDNFPTTVSDGDVYVYGDYEYRYNQFYMTPWSSNDTQNGWGVRAIDPEKTTYGLVLESINNKYITSMSETFCSTNITDLPEDFRIPNSVTYIDDMFGFCSALKQLPNSFTIPMSVTSMNGLFYNSAIEKLPEGFTIPNSVEHMIHVFDGCSSLTGTITINANPTAYENCFKNTEQPIEITGTSSMLDEIAATATNGNVTVK